MLGVAEYINSKAELRLVTFPVEVEDHEKAMKIKIVMYKSCAAI
jgi:hypothetical protein